MFNVTAKFLTLAKKKLNTQSCSLCFLDVFKIRHFLSSIKKDAHNRKLVPFYASQCSSCSSVQQSLCKSSGCQVLQLVFVVFLGIYGVLFYYCPTAEMVLKGGPDFLASHQALKTPEEVLIFIVAFEWEVW